MGTAPIDKYHVAMNFGHGEFAERSVPAGHHGVPFRTWLRGAPMGQHRFSVAAVNRAGRSQCVEVPVLASQEDAFRDVENQWLQGSQPHDPRHIPEHHRMYGRPRHVVTNDAGHRFQDASWQVQSDTSLTGAQVAAEVAANRGNEHWHPSARDHQHAYNGQFGRDSRARHHRAGHQTDTQTVASATTFSGGGVTPGAATRHSSGAHGDHRAVASTMRLDTTRGLPLQPSWSQTSTRHQSWADDAFPNHIRSSGEVTPHPQVPTASQSVSSEVQSGANETREGHDAEATCAICLVAPPTHAFIPCGHRCVCRACGDRLVHMQPLCPICRSQPIACLQIFT